MSVHGQTSAMQTSAVAAGFSMSSDQLTGRLLATLACSKLGGRLLELGTGVGMGSAWLLSGMDATAQLLTIDNNPDLTRIAQEHLGHDPRIRFLNQDGLDVLYGLQGQTFDLIFADTWPGKIHQPELALALVAPGGFYVVDDMKLGWKERGQLEEPLEGWLFEVWQVQHGLSQMLLEHPEFVVSKLDWSTGLMVATRKALGA